MSRTAPIWVAAFPIVLAAGVVTIPVVADYGDHELAVVAVNQAARWYWGHMVSALAFGIGAISATAVQLTLTNVRAARPPSWAVPLVIAGALCHVYGLGADGIGPVAILAGGESPESYFDGLGFRLMPVFVAGAGSFAVGWIAVIGTLIKNGVVNGPLRFWLPAGVVLLAAAEAIPSGWGLYVVAALALAVWPPLARALYHSSNCEAE